MANEPQETCEECEEGAPEWIVTFGDLMSLLLCFFILLLSFSQMDSAKYKDLAGSLEKAFGVQRLIPTYETPKGMKLVARDFDQAFIKQPVVGEGSSDPLELEVRAMIQDAEGALRELVKTLQEQGLVEIDKELDRIVMRLMGQTAFDSGQATIKPEMIPLLDRIGEIIGNTDRHILVAGHTDDVPLHGGPYGSNLGLSAARAAAVVEFFVKRGHVRPDKIATMAFGEYRPLVPNDTPEHRARNRRVEIILASLDLSH